VRDKIVLHCYISEAAAYITVHIIN